MSQHSIFLSKEELSSWLEKTYHTVSHSNNSHFIITIEDQTIKVFETDAANNNGILKSFDKPQSLLPISFFDS